MPSRMLNFIGSRSFLWWGIACYVATVAVACPGHAHLQPAPADLLPQTVGQVHGNCCQPGRRYGCDPRNLGQTGCVRINGGPSLNCISGGVSSMICTGAACRPTIPDQTCVAVLRTIHHNQCQPTGEATTAGCATGYWQCNVIMYPYTRPEAPASNRLVCDAETSTICSYSYSMCD